MSLLPGTVAPESAARVVDIAKVGKLGFRPKIDHAREGRTEMPSFDELVFGLNVKMNDKAVRRTCRDDRVFAESESLTVEVFDKVGLRQTGEQRELLRAHLALFPAGVAGSLMHILRFVCKEENEDIPILLIWLGGYYRLDVQHSHKTPVTRGMVTVVIRTPPPSSPRPS
jgi:hypothetical protein